VQIIVGAHFLRGHCVPAGLVLTTKWYADNCRCPLSERQLHTSWIQVNHKMMCRLLWVPTFWEATAYQLDLCWLQTDVQIIVRVHFLRGYCIPAGHKLSTKCCADYFGCPLSERPLRTSLDLCWPQNDVQIIVGVHFLRGHCVPSGLKLTTKWCADFCGCPLSCLPIGR
jgi:hypothetical protein